jgi:hypothetical protein
MMPDGTELPGTERFRDGGIYNDLQRELKVGFIKRIWSHVFAL